MDAGASTASSSLASGGLPWWDAAGRPSDIYISHCALGKRDDILLFNVNSTPNELYHSPSDDP
jgi:hypothetical protein